MKRMTYDYLAKTSLSTGLTLLLNTTALAQTPANPPAFAVHTLETGDRDSTLQLEVRRLPLADVLKSLSEKTRVPIHYSVLPDGLITATCAGKALKPVLECLLDHKADVIVRYKRHSKKGTIDNAAIAEAWVLGSRLEARPADALCRPGENKGEISLIDKSQVQTQESTVSAKLSQSDQLLKIAENGGPQDRAQAISDLLMIGSQNDSKVKEMLEQAAHDPDEHVRAQAISTLTHREDYSEHGAEIIREALQDQSIDVRLMAVDGINGDASLLELALNDPDETVRSIATLKLDELRRQGQSGN